MIDIGMKISFIVRIIFIDKFAGKFALMGNDRIKLSMQPLFLKLFCDYFRI